jgi:hypothetical protein
MVRRNLDAAGPEGKEGGACGEIAVARRVYGAFGAETPSAFQPLTLPPHWRAAGPSLSPKGRGKRRAPSNSLSPRGRGLG